MEHYQHQQYLSDETLEEIQQLLSKIAGQVNARLVLLADPTGQELSFYGALAKGQAEILSALSAGQLGASQELINALDISQEFTWMIREGPDYNCFLSMPAQENVLLLVVPVDTPLGWVRHVLKKSTEEMANLLAKVKIESQEQLEQDSMEDSMMEPDFVSSLLDSMDSLWEEGFD